ncbi:MAG: hypothetical protein ACK5TH_20405 [Prosthecobacter sp.]|jgi:hypothetical protein
MIGLRVLLTVFLSVVVGCTTASVSERVPANAPYTDLLPISKETWHRRFSQVLASHRGEINDPRAVVVCGPGVRLPSVVKPGRTIQQAVLDSGRHDVDGFCALAVFRPRDNVFYSVTNKRSRPHDPFAGHLFFTDRLLPGDTLILLERMFCF